MQYVCVVVVVIVGDPWLTPGGCQLGGEDSPGGVWASGEGQAQPRGGISVFSCSSEISDLKIFPLHSGRRSEQLLPNPLRTSVSRTKKEEFTQRGPPAEPTSTLPQR